MSVLKMVQTLEGAEVTVQMREGRTVGGVFGELVNADSTGVLIKTPEGVGGPWAYRFIPWHRIDMVIGRAAS